MTKEEFFKISNRVKSQNTCLAHDFDPSNCQTTPISSHSIARNEQLSRLSESNKVYIWEKENCDEKIFHELDKSNGKLNFSFRDFTIKKASTFPGFCNYHDTKLFSLIDKPISTFTKETILQLHYRAICYEFFRKKKSIELFDELPYNSILEDYLDFIRDGFEDLKEEKEICEKSYSSANANNDVKATIFEFNVPTPVECVGGWLPTFTIDKTKKLFHGDESSPLPTIGTTLGINAAGNAFWALTYTKDCSEIKSFIENLKLYINKHFLDIAILFNLQKSENACCRPSWFEGLQTWQKEFINRGFNNLYENQAERVTGVHILNAQYTVSQTA